MTRTIIISDEASTEIAIVGDMTDEQALEAHGYDPQTTDFSVQKSGMEELMDRIEQLENA